MCLLCLYLRRQTATMLIRERECQSGGRKGSSSVRHDPLEFNPLGCQFGGRGSKVARGAQRALPNLLAAGFLVRLSARAFNRGRAGSYPGLFCKDTGTWLASARRPRSGTVPLTIAQVA